MVMRSVAVAFFASLTLTACASQEQQIAAAGQINKTDDQFQPFRQYTTGIIRNPPLDATSNGNYEMELISQVDRASGAHGVGLQFTIHYFASLKRNYNEARNGKAELLHVHGIYHRKYDCTKSTGICIFNEAMLIDLRENELRAAGNDGYALKLFPVIGQGIPLTIPKSLIASLYSAVDAGEKQVASAQHKP